jgi:hypothetical protein
MNGGNLIKPRLEQDWGYATQSIENNQTKWLKS